MQVSIRHLVTQEHLVGVQAIVGQRDLTLLRFNAGVRSASDATPIDNQTIFCIGSRSKPFASATGGADVSNCSYWVFSYGV